ncbi:MAG TPA: nucleotidyltransferase domain-containing protein [Polyangiaceae bacterium]|nr:nucleotidyltransferase domain-containing protein [Polyangiaceae bacterium]
MSESEPRRVPSPIAPRLYALKQRLVDRFGARLREYTLFGSWVNGLATEDSDIDVLVVIDDLTSSERREVWNSAFDIDLEDEDGFYPLSPLCYASVQVADIRARERRLVRDIDREGIAV